MSRVCDIIIILHIRDLRVENGETVNVSKTIIKSMELHEKIEYDESGSLLSNVAVLQASCMIEKSSETM